MEMAPDLVLARLGDAALADVAIRLGDAAAQQHLSLVEALAVFAAHDQAFVDRVDRRYRRVLVLVEHDVVGQPDMAAEVASDAEIGREKARLALHCRVGVREVGRVGNRYPEHLHEGVAVTDLLLRLVMLDRLRLKLPDKRPLGIFLADLAGRIHTALHHGKIAVAPRSLDGGEPAVVGQQHAKLLHHAVLHAVGQLDELGEDHVAARLQQPDVSGRADGLRPLVVADAVRHQNPVALGNLDIPARQDRPELAVLGDLVGLEQDRLIGSADPLRGCGRDGEHGREEDRDRAENQAHQPSSRWNSMARPTRLVTPAGVHAASRIGTLAESPSAWTISVTK